MAEYTVKDESTGRVVTFDWQGDADPTDNDMAEVFAAAGTTERKPSGATRSFASPADEIEKGMENVGKEFPRIPPAYMRPVLELGGMVAGGMLATPASIGTFNPAPTIAGAGLGYAAGATAADIYENRPPEDILTEIGTTGKRFVEGTGMEMGGQTLVAGAKLGLRKAYDLVKSMVGGKDIPITTGQVMNKANEILQKLKGKSPQYAKNAEETIDLENTIPGYKSSMGERANDPELLKLQRGLERKPGEASDLMAQRRAGNVKALNDYLDSQFTGGKTVDDVISELNRQKVSIDANVQKAIADSQTRVNNLSPVESQQVGRDIVAKIESSRIPEKKTVVSQYQALPNESLPVSNTSQAMKEIEKDFLPGDEDVFPFKAISRVRQALKVEAKPKDPYAVLDEIQGIPKQGEALAENQTVGFQDLHSLRKDIGRQAYDAMSGANPNRELAMKLNRLKGAIDSDIEAGMGANNEYVQAREAYAEYAHRFRTGAVNKILQRGNQASGLNIPDALIANRVWTPDGADDLIRAIGKDHSKTVMEGFAANDLLRTSINPTTKELLTPSLNRWLSKNRVVLDKFGLTKEFDSLSKAQATLDAAKTTQEAWNKSIASKLLNADAGKAIEAAMGGAEGVSAKNTGEIMIRLIDQVKGNPDAVSGLKSAFKEFIISKTEGIVKTIAGDPAIGNAKLLAGLKKYEPAMRVLYRDEPQKLAALQNVQKAVEISSRSVTSPIGGGSDTAENIGSGAMAVIGTLFSHVVGKTGLQLTLAKRGLNWFNKAGAEELNSFLYRAMYDADFAETLMMAKHNVSPAYVEKNLMKNLASIGIYGTNKAVRK